jgi:hypothetical protein
VSIRLTPQYNYELIARITPMSEDNANDKYFSTRLLWSMAAETNLLPPAPFWEYVPVISHMFPGINYIAMDFPKVMVEIASPAVRRMHPELRKFAKPEVACEKLGATLPVSAVKHCDGFQWQVDNAWRRGLNL